MASKASVKPEFRACILRTREDIIADMSLCDRPVYDWLLSYHGNEGWNGVHAKYLGGYEASIAEDLDRAYEAYATCRNGNRPTTTPEQHSNLKVLIQAKGVGAGSSGSSDKSLSSTLTMGFAPITPEVCGKLQYPISHNIDRVWANNCTAEVDFSASGGYPSMNPIATANDILDAVLGFTVSLRCSRLVSYSVQFKDIPEFAVALTPRVEGYAASQVALKYSVPIPSAQSGWEVYIEVWHTDTKSCFWCGWRVPFMDDKSSSSGTDRGSDNTQLEAASLFTSHPGVAYRKLQDWVDAVGPDGTWTGRLVVYNSYVEGAYGSVIYGGTTLSEDVLFPPAPLYISHVAYSPGAPGMVLIPRKS